MHAIAWTDVVCPWCYLGRDRTLLLRELGMTVSTLGFELHPDTPAEGRAHRRGGRLEQVFTTIGAECAELGIPFRPPTRTPNSRRALETLEVVRQHWPDAYEPLEASLFRTHWVDGGDLADPATLDRLVRQAGADPAALHELVADGVGRRGLEASMDLAREHGVTATPAWLIDDTLLIPGAQPREAMRRWVTRLQERSTAPKDR